MTKNQIEYQNNVANQRLQAQKNRIAEWTLEEQQRANAEIARANKARERLQSQGITQSYAQLNETSRSNRARENLTAYSNYETSTHNRAQEKTADNANMILASRASEEARTNRRNEEIRQEANDIDRYGKALSTGASVLQSLLRFGGRLF